VGSIWKGKELLKGKEWLKKVDRKSAPRTFNIGLRKAKLKKELIQKP
jgi:hypothetical protein